MMKNQLRVQVYQGRQHYQENLEHYYIMMNTFLIYVSGVAKR